MPVADLILENARVFSQSKTDAPRPPTAIAVKGNKILLVTADRSELESVTGPGTRVIDCQSKTVIPGINDAHIHLFSLMYHLLSADLMPAKVKSISEIKLAIRAQAERTPPGKWITGAGYNEFYLAEKRSPTRWDIDEVVPDRPVILTHRSLHACVLNTAALSTAGISTDTPEPPGALFERDLVTGKLNGILYGMLGYLREKVMPPFTDRELVEGMALVNRYLLAYGVTSVQEASANNDYHRWQRFQKIKHAGQLETRVYMMFGYNALGQFQEAGLNQSAVPDLIGDAQLRLGGVKIMVNKDSGALCPLPQELSEMVAQVNQAGFQVAIHAVEQDEVEAAISALEHIGAKAVAQRRHRIEHCSECPPPLLQRLRRLKPVVVTQPAFLHYNGERYLATVAPEVMPTMYRIKSLLDNGILVAASSDCPVVPANPIAGLYGAVTRRAASGLPAGSLPAKAGQALLPEEAVTVNQAIALYTLGSAYASFEETIKGAIAPEKLADLVVLSADLSELPPDELMDVTALMTIIDGRVVWET